MDHNADSLTRASAVSPAFTMNRTVIYLMALIFASFASQPAQAEQADRAHNPLIWADVPDIAVIRVGKTYYMSSTTMHMNPGLPIMKSTDLVNWSMASYAYQTHADNEALRLENGRNAYGKGSWASSLRFHDGVFYASTFSYTSGRTHIYTTRDPDRGPWKEASFEPALHDHSLFFDDDGRVYMVYGGGRITLVELKPDLSGIQPGGVNKVLIENVNTVFGADLGGLNGEGSQLSKINGRYYLFNIASPGSRWARTVIVHRADTITGPYEGRIALDDRGIAQGGLIDTPEGKWYAYLFKDNGAVGRIPYLVPVTWKDGWPVLGQNGKVPMTLDIPAGEQGVSGVSGIVASDEFDRKPGDPALPLAWQWNHNPDNDHWSITARPGFLRLTTARVDSNVEQARNTLTQRTFGPTCSATTGVDVSHLKSGDTAGLIALMGDYGYIGVKATDTGRAIVMTRAEKRMPVEVASVPLTQDTVHFRIDCDFADGHDKGYFYYSLDGHQWNPIGEAVQLRYTGAHFMGCRFGLFNFATQTAGGYADFDYYRLGQGGVSGGPSPTLSPVAPATRASLPPLPPFPAIPAAQPVDSVPMADSRSAPEVRLDLPITPGPFAPTWESIEKNYPGTPAWLRDAKFGIWVHFGPQAAGKSGDWYARNLYKPGTTAYRNHLANYGHPSEVGYKEVLRDWNPTKLDPAKLVQIYKDAGARYLIIQGVHHDQFDLWNSRYQPWNSTRLGPKRDLLGEWTKAARAADIRFGVTFHHEYSWWWWQTAFGADGPEGPKPGVSYDGHLTLADGKGKWWEGLDPRLLYGVDLREYKDVVKAANDGWSPPPAGIFQNHAAYAKWYATWWALRMMDVVDQYQPDFIYTDGWSSQPFSGWGTGTGQKSDAMQRVIADFYNKTLQRRGKVDVFSIVKFRPKTNGTVNTAEADIPKDIKSDQDWIAEAPVGDWFYAPGFTNDSGAVIRFLLEEVSRDGNVGLCISPLPDGSLDDSTVKMLKEIGEWMRLNGAGIYGSKAWTRLGEGADGKLNVLPGGKIGRNQADHRFAASDLRFTVGKDGNLYAYCMTVPATGTQLRITSLGTVANALGKPVKSVTLLGYTGTLTWKQAPDALVVTLPDTSTFRTALGFKIETK